MTSKIFKSILTVAASVLLITLTVMIGVLYDYFGNVQESQLSEQLNLAETAVAESGEEYLKNAKSDRYRLTWIDKDGTVLYDTATDASKLPNHAEREEIKQAFNAGYGVSRRYSSTLTQKTVYRAKLMADGTVLRISTSYAAVWSLVIGMLQPILAIFVAALIISAVLAKKLSKNIVKPLNDIDLERPLENDTYEELAPLLSRIDRQHREIKRQLYTLRRKTDEFSQITENLNEGLVLLDNSGTVLNINPAARRIFGTDVSAEGGEFLAVDRSREMNEAIEKALSCGHSELNEERSGREYRFDISRIEFSGETLGCVILAFDITEKAFAEQTRREFTANVSHELKTPLQGIIGSADLIEQGMVKSEDMPRFVGHIKKEATRLLSLINDIIRLSELDESEDMPKEAVDLKTVSAEVAENLSKTAGDSDVMITVNGDSAVINGVPHLIYETIYNLCDNAVKYNKKGGSVTITTGVTKNEAAVAVKDTGIGIAPEHKDRIFERFYRVDKSHSKESGGTGLGLSIVKHAVTCHGGRIELTSEPGVGTEIKLIFPKKS